MEYDVDMNELEKQRYEDIKKSGEYLEINILMGKEKNNINDDIVSKSPVVTTTLHNCGIEEIACVYSTLKDMIEQFKKEWPLACMMSEMFMYTSHVESINIPLDSDKSKEE